MKKTFLAAGIFALALFGACKKGDKDQPVNLVTKISNVDGSTVQEYDYDSRHRLINIRFKNESRRDSDVISYDAAGRVAKFDQYDTEGLDESISYSYEGNTVTRTKTGYSSDGITSTSSSSFVINAQNQLLEQPRGDYKYMYEYDQNGNMVKKIKVYTDGTQNVADFYVFDDNSGMASNCTTPYWWFIVEDLFPFGSSTNLLSTKDETKAFAYAFDLHGYPEGMLEVKIKNGVRTPYREFKLEYITIK